MSNYHIAQINIARMVAPLDSPVMAGFVSRLEEINALADNAPGFVWRLQTPEGDATYLRPFDDDQIIVNMSVWESVEHFKEDVYKSAHAELLRQRHDWFQQHVKDVYFAMWWVPAGHIPGIDEAKKRLKHLEEHGPSQFAFTVRTIQPPDEGFLTSFDWSMFISCPA